MRVRVLLFATLKDLVGAPEITWSGRPGSTLADLLADLEVRYPALAHHRRTTLLAMNHEFADPTTPLSEGDEVALMPPVSGGAATIRVGRAAIDVDAVLNSVHRPDAGAVVLFLGTVRSDPGVRALDYETYRPMALDKLRDVADRAKATFGVLDVSIVHRVGRVALGRSSVAVAVSSAHRAEAFAACAWAMEEVKRIVPIWKSGR